MEVIKEFFYDYGLWVAVAAAAVIILLLVLLVAAAVSKGKLKKQNKQLSDNNARYAREINDLRYLNDRMMAAKTQAETELAEVKAAPGVEEVPLPQETFDNVLHATIDQADDEDDEFEVTSSYDETAEKPAAVAYSVKFDRPKNSWVIMKTGQERPVRRVPTKEEALKIARELAKKTGAGLYVHKKDGKFQKV